MNKPLHNSDELYVWPIIGYAIGFLSLELANQQPIQETHLWRICETLAALGPIWYVVPALASLYALYRAERLAMDAPIVMFAALIGGCIGYMTSAYVMASPGPNYSTERWTVPFWCLIGCLAGTAIALYLDKRLVTRRPRETEGKRSTDV